ncbi:T3SS effector HopA1 family protein [Kitasatospora sp. NPDC006697]|uniref:T3SS effector HopA1 family protein n=1 Tax=Kitasatospora sp. NPDC006697 TaxID=3364020 RepID=UPI00369351E9
MDHPTGGVVGEPAPPTRPRPAADDPQLADRLLESMDTVTVDLDAATVTVAGLPHTFEKPQHARVVLRTALYESWHAGIPARSRPDALRPGRPRGGSDLERALAAAVPHQRTRITATVVGPTTPTALSPRQGEPDDAVVVAHGGVRLCVPGHALTGPEPTAGASVLVDVPAIRPWLSPGFLLVHGSAGGARRGDRIQRLYVHLARPDAAVPVWSTVLAALERRHVPYQAKILSEPRHYPRRDALVVYLGTAHADAARAVADAVAEVRAVVSGIGEQTSVFAARIAPGVAQAAEPHDPRPGWQGLSFGQHRAAAVADGLIDHARNPRTATREEAVTRALLRAGVHPLAPEQNLR